MITTVGWKTYLVRGDDISVISSLMQGTAWTEFVTASGRTEESMRAMTVATDNLNAHITKIYEPVRKEIEKLHDAARRRIASSE